MNLKRLLIMTVIATTLLMAGHAIAFANGGDNAVDSGQSELSDYKTCLFVAPPGCVIMWQGDRCFPVCISR